MDILDEIDAQLHEKKSKWSYTPMREKSETDAIIDDLLREFAPESSAKSHSPARFAVKEEASAVQANEESLERIEYEKAVSSQTPNFDIPPVEDEVVIPQDLSEHEYDEYAQEEYGEEYYEQEPYDEENYEDAEEYYEEESAGGSDDYSGEDFDNFMDSENDGQKGDVPSYWFSNTVKTIFKIVVLAAVGALIVLGAVKAVDMVKEKYGFGETVSKTDPLKAELQKVIMPLVVTDIGDFENVSELESEDLINIAVWELVINGEKKAFIDEESGECRLSAGQMEYIINKLFGETKFEHGSAGVGDVKIEYDKKNEEYIIPENTDIFSYSPKVTDISDTDPVYTVYADCYSSPSWETEDSKPDKRVMITLEKTDEYYNIVSQKTIPVE